jgi:hypothetical protein
MLLSPLLLLLVTRLQYLLLLLLLLLLSWLQCAQGYFSPGGNQEPCLKCPDGFTTNYDPTHPEYQRLLSDCYVMPGHGELNIT